MLERRVGLCRDQERLLVGKDGFPTGEDVFNFAPRSSWL